MSPDLIRRIGETLYGPLWRSRLAEEIGVDRRTIHYWTSGVFGPVPKHREKIIALVEKHRDAVDTLIRFLRDESS